MISQCHQLLTETLGYITPQLGDSPNPAVNSRAGAAVNSRARAGGSRPRAVYSQTRQLQSRVQSLQTLKRRVHDALDHFTGRYKEMDALFDLHQSEVSDYSHVSD